MINPDQETSRGKEGAKKQQRKKGTVHPRKETAMSRGKERMSCHGKNLLDLKKVPGPSRQAIQASTDMDQFNLFLPLLLVQTWVDETNRYATELRKRKLSNMKWVNVSLEEHLAYIGMLIAMGLVNLPSELDYFITESMLSLNALGSSQYSAWTGS